MVPGYGLGQGHGKGYGQGYGSGFRVSVMVRFRDQCQDHGSLFIVHGSRFRVQGSGSWTWSGSVSWSGCMAAHWYGQDPWLHTLSGSMAAHSARIDALSCWTHDLVFELVQREAGPCQSPYDAGPCQSLYDAGL